MASAQVEQQTAQGAPEQAENQDQQPCPEALHEEVCEPAVQIQDSAARKSALLNEAEATCPPAESGMREQGLDAQQPAAENQSTGSKEASAPGSVEESKSAESAQLRARRLAEEAAEAQEAAQQAAKLAAEKQLQAYEAAKEARDAIHAEHEAARAAALHDVEVIAERACKQQKLCAESSQETLRELVQTTAEESLRQAVGEKGNGPNESIQSSTGAVAARDDALRSVPRQLAAGATETVQQMIETTANKTVEDISSLKEGSSNMEQDKNPVRESEQSAGPETPTRPGPQMGAQALEGVSMQPPSVNGIQVHPLDPNVITQNPFVNTSVLPVNVGPDSIQNSATGFTGKAPEGDTFRTVPVNQPTEQGPSPMQVG